MQQFSSRSHATLVVGITAFIGAGLGSIATSSSNRWMQSNDLFQQAATPTYPSVNVSTNLPLPTSAIISLPLPASASTNPPLPTSASMVQARQASVAQATLLSVPSSSGVNSTRLSDTSNGWKVVGYFRGKSPLFWKNYTQQWSSQVGQDRTIVEILKGKQGGYFVDLAANDAVHLSNTLALEQHYGWRGLCVEPNPQYLAGLLDRKCSIAVAATGQTDEEVADFRFNNVFGGIIGNQFDNKPDKGAGTAVKMPLVSVEKLFRDFGVPAVIDYMSLDVEGAELYSFAKFPWDKYTFLTMTVERPRGLKELLVKNGYHFVRFHGNFGDALFIHKSLPNFAEVMAKYNPTGKK